MAYPQGINFRATAAFATDGTNEDHEVESSPGALTIFSSTYPRTSAQGNTVGCEITAALGVRDRNSGNDRRIVGSCFSGSNAQWDYRFDLPSAGTYNIGLASGDGSYTASTAVSLVDTSTSLGALSSGSTSTGNHFKDATNTDYAAASWPGSMTLVSKTFSTTICRFRMASGATNDINHAYVASAAAADTLMAQICT